MLIVTNCDRRNRSDESALFQILKARLNRLTISDKRHPKRRFKTQMEYLFAFRVHPASFDVNRGMTDAQKAVVILCIERGQSSPRRPSSPVYCPHWCPNKRNDFLLLHYSKGLGILCLSACLISYFFRFLSCLSSNKFSGPRKGFFLFKKVFFLPKRFFFFQKRSKLLEKVSRWLMVFFAHLKLSILRKGFFCQKWFFFLELGFGLFGCR